MDFYDVSMVDGSNLPMYINVTKGKATKRVSRRGCVPAGCTKLVACPKVLRVKASGKVVACESACAKFGVTTGSSSASRRVNDSRMAARTGSG
jgi:hypothetical protein